MKTLLIKVENKMTIENIISKKKRPRYVLLFESLCQKYNLPAGAIFGKILNLELYGKYGEFRGSLDFLGGRFGLSYSTTIRTIKLLLKEKLIIDTTPDSKRKQRMQTKHYKTNQIKLIEISSEMDLTTDEKLSMKKIANEIKKKSIQDNAVNNEILAKIFELDVDDGIDEEYENPFEELDEEI